MKDILRRLIRSLSDDQGVSEATYDAIHDLLECIYGDKIARDFSLRIKTTEGRFYLKECDIDASYLILPD